MILSVSSDQKTFKDVRFEPGFNVVLAERGGASSDKDSRNGLGKSTLIDIIQFCLGSSPTPRDILRTEPLLGWQYRLELTLHERKFQVGRNSSNLNQIAITGDTSWWPIQPRMNQESGEQWLSRDDWTRLLGWAMFGLSPELADEKYTPTFRSLMSYFSRRTQSAYVNPFEQHSRQQDWDKQVNTAFLLGLNWRDAQRRQILRDRETALKQLNKAVRSGVAAELLGPLGSLESTKVRLEREVQREGDALASFQVHPQYRQLEEEANTLTFQIRDLTNANVTDQGMLKLYEQSLAEETPADEQAVTEIYSEAGVILPDLVTRRLDEVREFHRQVARNRRAFLEGEIGRLRTAIANREATVENLTQKRAVLMSLLRSHGALEEYNRLQHLHNSKLAELDDLDRRLGLWRRLEREQSAIKIEKERLRLDTRADLEDRRPEWGEAINLFNANSEALYDAPGELIIDLGESGLHFDVSIERSGSHGINHMKVFCYDLMLAQLWSKNPVSPGFLIHDSIIFDGVDERQRARALQLAAKESEKSGFQYICFLNSDMVPYGEFDSDFHLDDYVRLALTDASEDGGLLGMRF